MIAGNHGKMRHHKLISILGSIVVFCTTYALILPVITATKETFCDYSYHEHTDDCYEKVLTCQEEVPEGHEHTDACYAPKKVLSCGLEEQEPHTHTEACWKPVRPLICNQEQHEAHKHGDDCFSSVTSLICGKEECQPHTHDDNCFITKEIYTCGQEEGETHTHDASCITSERALVCELPEGEGHVHVDSCWKTEQELNCDLPEDEGHVHSDACYGEAVQTIVCTLPELAPEAAHKHTDACYTDSDELELVCEKEVTQAEAGHVHSEACYAKTLICEASKHVHTLQCYSNRNAGVEAPEDWEETLPELSGNPAKDMAKIARSQLEYRSITANYIVLDEEARELAFYNRYAAWYSAENEEEEEDENAAYRDWNSLFAAFCMHYAGVENDPERFSADADAWASNLFMAKKLSDPAEAAPGTGDLLFFENEDGETLVSVVTETDEKEITVIAGDILTDGNRTVAEISFAADADCLLGFLDVEDTGETELMAAVGMPALTSATAPTEEDPRSSWPVVGSIYETGDNNIIAEKPLLAAAPKKSMMLTSGAHDVMLASENPVNEMPVMLGATRQLPDPGKLDIATVSAATMYWKAANEDPHVSTGWQEITPTTPLQGNEHIRLKVDFSSLKPADIIDNGYQMQFTLPAGLERCDTTGTLTIGQRIVATLSATADQKHITIDFDQAWVDSLGPNALQMGNFFITAEFDHSALDDEKHPEITIGDTTISVPVTPGDLLAKYGQVNMTKTVAEDAVQGEDGKYYLTYTLRVEAGEHGSPAVTVEDTFADTSNITAINGVSATAATASDNGNTAPKDTRVSGTAATGEGLKCPGTVSQASKDAPMIWTLGDMGPYEVRELTYTVQLSEEYTSTYHGSDETLDNTAKLKSNGNERNTDTAHFTSKTDLDISKTTVGTPVKNDNGTYTISYELTVRAPADNDFPVKNVTIDDSFVGLTPGNIDEWVRYNEGSFKVNGVAVPGDSGMYFENNGTSAQRGDAAASFHNLPIGDMAPGATKTVTYTADLAEEAFALISGSAHVGNTAKVLDNSNPRKEADRAEATTDVDGIRWSRKSIAETLMSARTENMDGDNFSLGRGALKYQLVVNESGEWNMNQTTIFDAAVNEMLKIVGYVRVDAYIIDDTNRPAAGLSDAAVVTALEGTGVDATAWIKTTDGATQFSQTVSGLGFPALPAGTNYAYVLTYYAEPDVSKMGSSTSAMVSVGNTLRLSGSVIGKVDKEINIDTTVTSTITVSNPNKFDVKKTAWYYEEPGEGLSGYVNGALYWVVRVDGNQLKQGLIIQDSSNRGSYKNFNHDGKDGSKPAFVGAFVGALGADANDQLYQLQDVYPDAGTLLASIGSGALRQVNYEIVAGQGQGRNAPVEVYYGDNITNDGSINPTRNGGGVEIDGVVYYNHDINVRFRTSYDIIPGESLYVVFRTEPMILPTKGSDTFTYQNKVNYHNGSGWVDLGNQAASQTLYGSDGIQKSVTYPKLYFVKNGEGMRQPGNWNSNIQGPQGPYAIDSTLLRSYLDTTTVDRAFFTGWNIRVNHDGKLNGTYRIKEIIPDGMELTYLRLAGRGAGTQPFTFNEISGLESEGWTKVTYTPSTYTGKPGNGNNGSVTVGTEITTVIYYKKGNEVLFELSSFEGNKASNVWADIQVITHVTDEKANQGQATDFENRSQLLDRNNNVLNSAGADVTLALSDMIGKSIATSRDGDTFNSSVLPFRIQINDYLVPGTSNPQQTIPDLNPEGTTVNLVDEMSNALIIDPDSVRIYYGKFTTDPWTNKSAADPQINNRVPKYDAASTDDYKGYTVVITDGGSTMKINDLPDNKIMTMFYNTTVDVAPGKDITISNDAHWEGVSTPSSGSSVAESFKYTSSGTVEASPTLRIRKVDPSDAQGSILGGATFKLQAVKYFDYEHNTYIDPAQNVSFQDALAVNLQEMTRTTQDSQLLIFGHADEEAGAEPHLVYHTVYKLVETEAPNGYVCDSTPYYFIIGKATGEDSSGNNTYPRYLEYINSATLADGTSLADKNVYVFYGGPDYTYTAYNRKGEIEVTKTFGGNAEGGRPVEGTYYFGLYDFVQNGLPLGEPSHTALITYTAADVAEYDSAMLNGGTYTYKSVLFHDLKLNIPYYLFETDAKGTPASDGGLLNVNGESFVADYSFPDGSTIHQLVPRTENNGSLKASVANKRYQATATKSFADVAGATLSQGLVGTYDFGIWKADASEFDLTQPPLDKKSVVFRIQDSNVSEKSVVFGGLLPGTYAIYELDENGAPVTESTSFQHTSGGAANDFIVHYTDGVNEFPIPADGVDIPDVHAVNTSSVALPMTGGIGTLPYQLGGLLLIGISLLASFGLRRRKRKEVIQ